MLAASDRWSSGAALPLPASLLTNRLKTLLPYAATTVLVLLGAALRIALEPIAGDLYTFTIFYAVVPLVAWRYGLRLGLIALGLSAIVASYVLLDPGWQIKLQPNVLLGHTLFLLIGFGLAVLGDAIRRSRAELSAQTAELQKEVAERKAAEADVVRLNGLLSERLDELQAIIDASPIAIGVATDVACAHIWGNSAYAELLGVPADSNISKSSAEADQLPFKFYQKDVEVSASELPMQRSARDGISVRDVELEVVRDDGRRITLLGNTAPLHGANGRIRGSVGLFADITQRQAVEQEREEANRRKDEFLATLAHELRNPLAPLRNAASIIRQRGHDDDRLRRASDVIERQVVHMVRLIDDLLDVARITRGLIGLQKEHVDLRALVWQAVELVRPQLDARKHQLRVELPLHPLPLYVDRVRVIQAISNILGNAAKYTPEQGSILITADEGNDTVRLKIRDSGIGISPELLPKVFDVFVQGDRTLARSDGGLGIGLTLVKRIMDLHQGRVEASSAGPNKGAEFVIALPFVKPPAVPKERAAAAGEAAHQRILVVDDNRDVADTLSVLLEMMRHEARIAYSGEEALAVAREFKPTLAFFDLGLPGMDGYELARRFRADPALRDVRLVALTGYGRATDRAHSLDAGFDVHLTKPFDPDRLERLVQEVIANEPRNDPSAEHESGKPSTTVSGHQTRG